MDNRSLRRRPAGIAEVPTPLSPFGESPYAWPDQRDTKASLHAALRILRRGKWVVLAVTLLVLGLVTAYTLLLEPVYESYTVLMIEDQQPDNDALSEALSSGIIGALGRGDRGLTNQALLLQQSLVIAERTARRLLSLQDSLAIGPLTALGAEGQGEPALTDIAERIQERYVAVWLEDQERGNALRITATSTNPEEAALIANTYTAEYMLRTREASRRRIASARTFLETQLDEREDELRQLEDRIQQYMTREGAGALDEEVRRTVAQVAELEASLDEARIGEQHSLASLQSLQEELEEVRPKLAAHVASGAKREIEQAQGRISELEARLEQIYIKNPELRGDPSRSPDVADIQDQIAKLEARVGRLSEEYVDEMLAVGGTDPLATSGSSNITYIAQLKRRMAEERVAHASARARQQALQQRIEQYERRLRSIPEQSVELARLQRERQAAEGLYVSLSEKLREVRMAEEAQIGIADLIRPALVPDEPVRPNTTLNLILGLLLGMALGVVAAVLRYKLDSRIYTPDDLRRHNLSALGVIPDMHRVGRANGPGLPKANGHKLDVATATPQGASSAITEAYRRLHMSILFNRPGKEVRTVLVTSPEPDVGKSTTALNLAVAAARAGQRTLIVDADLRKPQIYTHLGQSSGPFLTDLLGETTIDADRLATRIDNLYAVTTREPLADADVVLSSDRMARLVERLRGAFDLVIFDSPPVLAVADAVALSRLCDVTLVVAGAGRTEAEALWQTAEELGNADAEVVGTVLNRFNPSEDSGHKYRYEDYGYATTPSA